MATAICFAIVALLESIPSTPLNGSLQNFNTRRVSVGREHYEEIFGYRLQKFGAPKLPILDDFSTQWQL